MEEKRDEFEEKKDTLMWNEEDYDAMQRITGFDDESVLEDQKRGVNLVIFIVVCIICLIVGILIGYNINNGGEEPKIDILPNPDDEVKVSAIYNRLNASNEQYLYVLNAKGEEISILDLTNLKYAYQYVGDNLFVLLETEGLTLYNYTFSQNTYHRDLIKKFEDKYDEFYFYNNAILLKKEDNIRIYNTSADLVKEITLDVDKILSCNLDYIIYEKDSRLNIYHVNSGIPTRITEDIGFFLYFDDDKLFYSESSKIFQYGIKNSEKRN